MKRLFLALVLLLTPSSAFAQCSGIFPPNSFCGNNSGAGAPPGPLSLSIIPGGNPGGTNGQIQYNNASAFGGFTASGDVTIVPTTGVTTIQPGVVTGTKIAAGTVANSNLITGAANTIKGSTNGTSTTDLTPTSLWDSFCSTTVGNFWVRLSGAWGCTSVGYANPVWWGADPTGAADSASALNSALAASSIIRFPAGTFKFLSHISYNIPAGVKSITLIGTGIDNTILTWPNSGGGVTINYAGATSSAHMHDLSFTTGTTVTDIAIQLSLSTSLGNPANTALSTFENISCHGADGYEVTNYWGACFNVSNVSNINWNGIMSVGPSAGGGNGIGLTGLPGSSTYGVAYNISKSFFNNQANGIVYSSFIQGVTVSQSNFTGGPGGSAGIIVSGTATGALQQLNVNGCQFGSLSNGILIGTSIGEVTITGNLFGVLPSGTGIGVSGSSGPAAFSITANTFQGGSPSSNNGIFFNGGGIGVITGNVFSGLTTGVNLNTSVVTSTNVQSNVYTSVTNATAPASTTGSITIGGGSK